MSTSVKDLSGEKDTDETIHNTESGYSDNKVLFEKESFKSWETENSDETKKISNQSSQTILVNTELFVKYYDHVEFRDPVNNVDDQIIIDKDEIKCIYTVPGKHFRLMKDGSYEFLLDKDMPEIGSIRRFPRNKRILSLSNGTKYKEKKIELPEGMENIFTGLLYLLTHYRLDEFLPLKWSDDRPTTQLFHNLNGYSSYVSIVMNRKRIKIKTQNLLFLVDKIDGVWTPEIFFGSFNESNLKAGVNANIFSKKFTVAIGDPINEVEYVQTWENNMKVCNEPLIIYNYERAPFVEIEYTLDHEKFGYNHYSEEAFQLFGSYVVDLTMTHRLPVKFRSSYHGNSQIKWYPRSVFDYGKLYTGHSDGVQLCGENVSKNRPQPLEASVFFTPGEGRAISFVNGKCTEEGGIHVDKIYDEICYLFGDENSDSLKNRLRRLRENFSVFVSCWLENPVMSGNKLFRFSPESNELEISMDLAQTKKISNWLDMIEEKEEEQNSDNGSDKDNDSDNEKDMKRENKKKKRGLLSRMWRTFF